MVSMSHPFADNIAVTGGISPLVHSVYDDISVPLIEHSGRRFSMLYAI